MIVITMNNCPPKLRGDLTKWLCEINTGVYVGNVSARVREALWIRVCENIGNGQATMVYSAANEQHLEFRTHNSLWKICDYDGIKLMLRPNAPSKSTEELPKGFSKASKYFISSRVKSKAANSDTALAFIDIETTGLDAEKDRIIEIAVIEGNSREIVSQWSTIIKFGGEVPTKITELTGITTEMSNKGLDIKEALLEFTKRTKGKKAVCYNRKFDIIFLEKAFRENGLEFPISKVIDALTLARKKILGIENYKLGTLAEFFEISFEDRHRALSDCEILYKVFLKLNEF